MLVVIVSTKECHFKVPAGARVYTHSEAIGMHGAGLKAFAGFWGQLNRQFPLVTGGAVVRFPTLHDQQ